MPEDAWAVPSAVASQGAGAQEAELEGDLVACAGLEAWPVT